MTTKPLENIVDLFDFAQSLRDGVILCQIINRLKPGTIVDFSEVSNIQMHLVSFSYYLFPHITEYQATWIQSNLVSWFALVRWVVENEVKAFWCKYIRNLIGFVFISGISSCH